MTTSVMRRSTSHLLQLALGTTLAGVAIKPVVAQTGGDFVLEEIVITAQKVSQDLQKVPLNVATVTGETLADAGVTDLRSINANVPSLTVVETGPGVTVSLRGAGTPNVGALGDPAVALNNDGIYMARSSGTNALMLDVGRVEVLKGPQGTLYGRNATVGVVNIISNKPNEKEEARFELETGTYSLVRAMGVVNVPVNDQLKVRGAVQTVDHKGYLRDGHNDADDNAARLHALYEPNDKVSLLLTGAYSEHKGQGYNQTLVPTSGGDPWAGLGAQPGRANNRNWLLSTELNWNLGFGNLTVLPAWQDISQRNLGYPTTTPLGTYNRILAEETSLEVRLASASDAPLRWLLGAFYFDETGSSLFQQRGTQASGARDAVREFTDIGTTSVAAFTQVTWAATSKLNLTGGLRYTNESKDFTGSIYQSLIVNTPGVVTPIAGTQSSIGSKVSYNNVSWKAGLDYNLSDASMLYASVSTGFKAGGINPVVPNTPTPYVGPDYAAEKLLAYAVGSKNRFFDNRLQVNAEIYYWDYKDRQAANFGLLNSPATGPFNLDLYTVNVGKSTLKGIDLEVSWAISRHDRVDLSVSHLDSEYGNYVVPAFYGPTGAFQAARDVTGQTPPNSPKWSSSARYEHVFAFASGADLAARVSAEYRSENDLNSLTSPVNADIQKAYVRGNVMLDYTTATRRFSMSAYCRNVTNKAVFTNVGLGVGAPSGNIQDPRTYGVVLGARF